MAQEDYQQKIKECLSSEELIFELDKLKLNILEDDTVTSAVEKLREICIAISDRTFKRISFEKNKNSNKRGRFCEWFDDDCKKFKSLVNEKRKTFQNAFEK